MKTQIVEAEVERVSRLLCAENGWPFGPDDLVVSNRARVLRCGAALTADFDEPIPLWQHPLYRSMALAVLYPKDPG